MVVGTDLQMEKKAVKRCAQRKAKKLKSEFKAQNSPIVRKGVTEI